MITTSIEDLQKEAEKIQSFLEITISGDNTQEVVDRGNDLIVYMARTGKMLSDAKYHLTQNRKSAVMQTLADWILDNKLSAKVQNSLVDSLCADELMLYEWIDRLNASCTHQLDWCRTMVSKNKEEMKLNNTGKEFR